MKRLLIVAALATLVACDSSTAPPFPTSDVTPIAARPQYEYWWRLVEGCSGLRGDFGDVQWFRSDHALLQLDGNIYSGYWWSRGNRIVLGRIEAGATVRHEMLHALLRTGDHPLVFFVDRCGPLVQYRPPPEYELLPSAADRAPTVPAQQALDVTIASNPATPRLLENGGYFTVTVSATNRTGRAVWVTLARGVGASFLYGPAQYDASTYPSGLRLFFRAGQRRDVVFDARAEGPGTQQAVGMFGGVTSAPISVTVAP